MHLTNDQIQVLLIEKLSGSISPEDDELISRLLTEDPKLQQQWLSLQADLSRLGGSSSSLTSISEEEAWNKVKANMRSPRILRIRRFVAAASVIILVAAAAFLWNRQRTPPIAQSPATPSTPAIALVLDNGNRLLLQHREIIRIGSMEMQADEQQMTLPSTAQTTLSSATLLVPPTLNYKLSLSDGSEVWLNSQSHLRFPLNFQGPKREVFLQGEAYFRISKDAQHPFIVHTEKTEVLVVGTEFNLNTYESDSISTALVAGAVITRDSSGHFIPLHPGLQSVYSATHGFHTKPFDQRETLSWLKGVYYFHNTPLKQIANVLSRWYNAVPNFTNTRLQDLTFSGELIKAQSLQSFLDNLNLAEDIHATISDGKIVFR